jgi:hypothetical protein
MSSEVSGAAPAAFVVRAAEHTAAQKTAEMTISGSITAAGTSLPISGSGQGNLNTGDARVTITAQVRGSTITARELYENGHLYLGLDAPGRSMRQLAGRDWFTVPMTAANEPSFLTGNPMQTLASLERQGATVKNLGSTTNNGQSSQGYSVTLSPDPPRKSVMVCS